MKDINLSPMLDIDLVLVPTDFSESAARALAHARELAVTHGARLDLLHVVEEAVFPSIYGAGAAALSENAPALEDRAKASLDRLASELGAEGVEHGFGCHVKQGVAAAEVVRFAEDHDVDLIVMGSHGQSALERVLVGSVADRVIRTALCPIFLVQTFGKSLLPTPESEGPSASEDRGPEGGSERSESGA
jgi:nucleotide-binding universal stress UspA family protein